MPDPVPAAPAATVSSPSATSVPSQGIAPPPPVTGSLAVLEERVGNLETELIMLRRALLSLGSAILAGGQPGPVVYLAWHDGELNPVPPPEAVGASSAGASSAGTEKK